MLGEKKMNSIFYKKISIFVISILFFGAIIAPSINASVAEQCNTQDGMVSVLAIGPDLVYSPTSHDFGNVAEGQLYETTFEIWNGGTGTLTWSLGIIHTWISPNPTHGKSDGYWDKVTVTVTIDTTGLSLGSHSGFVSITANDGGGVRYFNIDCNVVTNNPPNTPSQLSGPSYGNVDDILSYTSSTTDPEGDNIWYGLDYTGDGNVDHWSSNYYPSGFLYTIQITFGSAGIYHLRLKAKDIYGAESGWSPSKTVTISDNDPPNTPSTPTGPAIGNVDTSYSYSISTTDPDGDDVKYGWDWDGDGNVDEWSGFYSSGSSCSMPHSWTGAGIYQVKVKVQDVHGAESGWSSALTVTISAGNNAPTKPSTPTGPTSGKTGTSCSYSSSTTDIDGDKVYYKWDWGDEISGWDGPYNSGDPVTASHIWSNQGTYAVKVKAKDDPNGDGDLSDGTESVWSDPLSVSMPKNKTTNRPLLDFLENYPYLFQLLHQLLGL